MSANKSLEEIWRIKEKISSEIAGKSHEEIIRYFREKRPPEVGPLPRFEKAETARSWSETNRS